MLLTAIICDRNCPRLVAPNHQSDMFVQRLVHVELVRVLGKSVVIYVVIQDGTRPN